VGETWDRSRREQAAVLVAICVVVFGVAMAAAVNVLGTPTNECDNMAGTCIHMRQQAVIFAIRVVCLVAVVVPVVLATLILSARRLHALVVATLLVACAAVGVATLAVDPLPRLDNRWHGWLSGSP